MTIQKAKILLGEIGKQLADEEVQLIIDSFHQLIEIGFQQFEDKNINNMRGNCNETSKST